MDVGWIKGWMLMNVVFDNCVDNMLMFNDTLSERQPEMDIFILQDF